MSCFVQVSQISLCKITITDLWFVCCSLLMLQWKQDIEGAAKLINKALEIDDRCEFAYETLGTIEVQR